MVEGMLRADVIADDLWAVIEPVLPAGGRRGGRPWNDHRRTLEGIVWRFRTGSPWRDLPSEFGAWQSVWERHRRWSTDGTYVRMFAAARASQPVGGRSLQELLSIDSTSVRAHQHAAGALPAPHTGGWSELHGSADRAG
jgi:putative transposase